MCTLGNQNASTPFMHISIHLYFVYTYIEMYMCVAISINSCVKAFWLPSVRNKTKEDAKIWRRI